MPTILHFADAHIDMANYGRHDPLSGLPLRVLDFLKSLDTIIDTAIQERVDLVIFAGDAYKDRSPSPTFQREWGRRIMRLSRAEIPALLLVGNHDLPPALGRAHALESFDTLGVPLVRVLEKPELLLPQQLNGLPLQVLALPWISRSGLMAHLEMLIVAIGGDFLTNYYGKMSKTIMNFEELGVMLIFAVAFYFLVSKLPPMLAGIITGSSINAGGVGNYSGGQIVGAAAATMAVASMGATYLAEGARQMAAASLTAADAAKSINTSGGTPFATPNPDGSAQTVSHDPWEVPDDHLTRKPK